MTSGELIRTLWAMLFTFNSAAFIYQEHWYSLAAAALSAVIYAWHAGRAVKREGAV